jgi:hypothetical protein
MRAQASIATTTSGPDAAILERVGEALDVAVEVGVGDVLLLALLPPPVERDPVAVPGLHVAIDAVVRHVELAAHEPLGERRVGPVEHLVPGLGPVQGLRLLGPEALVVLVSRLVLGAIGDVRTLDELRRWRELRVLLEHLLELLLKSVVGHAVSSQGVCSCGSVLRRAGEPQWPTARSAPSPVSDRT